VKSDVDVLVVQTTCQQLCTEFFGATDVVRLATAVSELARNIYMYAKRGEVELSVFEGADGVRFSVVARDQGPGIPHLEEVLSGRYTSRTGLGRGLVGTRTLLDGMEIDSKVGVGTTVRGWKKVRAR
jgi:anti-sigma regulatory factor (Ser/Thr protein kinase)